MIKTIVFSEINKVGLLIVQVTTPWWQPVIEFLKKLALVGYVEVPLIELPIRVNEQESNT